MERQLPNWNQLKPLLTRARRTGSRLDRRLARAAHRTFAIHPKLR